MSGDSAKRTGWRSWPLLVSANVLIFFLFFSFAEIGYRVYRDGFPRAFVGLANDFLRVPYSNLGTSNWVIYDKSLGYRLNPEREQFNNRSVRHGEIEVPKPEGVFRILYLGDSIPWDRDGFVQQTRDLLEGRGRYEVINASVPGYTSYQEALFYKKYLIDTTPDLVVWTYCLNDNHRFLHRFDEKAKMLWTKEAQRTLGVDSPWDRVVSRSYLLTRLRLGVLHEVERRRSRSGSQYPWESAVDFNIAWKEAPWSDYEAYLVDLKGMLREHGGRLVVVVFPLESQLVYRNDTGNLEYVLKPQRKLVSLCEKNGVPCLDLYSDFAAVPQRLFRDGIHLNAEGHRLATARTLRFLEENQLLPF